MADRPIELLAGLPEGGADRVLALAELRTFADGEPIILEGEAGDCLFVVASGEVRVLKSTLGGTEEELTVLGTGECFGELSLVDHGPRSATVRAAGPAAVHAIPGTALSALFEAEPGIQVRVLENLVRITARRLRNLDDTLVRSLYDSVIHVDTDFRVIGWTRTAGEADLMPADRDPQTATGRPLFEVAEAVGAGVAREIMRRAASGKVSHLQLDYPLASGQQVYLELTVGPSRDSEAAGHVIGVRNVSETRELEAQVARAEKLAMAGRMAAEIGHELNNYLTVVSGHTELLMMKIGTEEREMRHVKAIADQLDRIRRFTSGLMDFSRMRPRSEPTDLNDLIGKLILFIQGQSRFRRVTFEQRLAAGLPLLELDPGQMQQVLLNLYANAADAAGEGRVVTETGCDAGSGRVTVRVSDDGPGMPPDVRERIFESGFTTKQTGHGFGLAVCKRVLEASGATIAVTSQEGKGTVFTLMFPAPDADSR